MTTIELTASSLDQASRTLSEKGPVSMLNIVRYRERAEYSGETGLPGLRDMPPCSGRDAYLARYAPAFQEVAALVAPHEKAVVTFLANVQAMLLVPAGEAWDDIVIVEYPSFAALRRILDSKEYEAKAAPHRRAALAGWVFVATTKMVVPA